MTPTPDSPAGTALLETERAPSTDQRTILLLDPVTLFLKLEETILARRDWTIHSARTAAEALEILEREHVDLLVMDHALPDAIGDEFIRSIRQQPRTRATGVLVLTARGSHAAVERCLDAGANGVLFKPVTRQDLCMRVEDLLYVAARRHVRTLVRLDVEASTGAGSCFAHSVNVSAGGMLLETSEPLAKGDVLTVRFQLPFEDAPVVARARVARDSSATDDGRFHAGLTFEGMSDADRGRLEAFVASQVNDVGALRPAII